LGSSQVTRAVMGYAWLPLRERQRPSSGQSNERFLDLALALWAVFVHARDWRFRTRRTRQDLPAGVPQASEGGAPTWLQTVITLAGGAARRLQGRPVRPAVHHRGGRRVRGEVRLRRLLRNRGLERVQPCRDRRGRRRVRRETHAHRAAVNNPRGDIRLAFGQAGEEHTARRDRRARDGGTDRPTSASSRAR
jgi:hypothetical protein